MVKPKRGESTRMILTLSETLTMRSRVYLHEYQKEKLLKSASMGMIMLSHVSTAMCPNAMLRKEGFPNPWPCFRRSTGVSSPDCPGRHQFL